MSDQGHKMVQEVEVFEEDDGGSPGSMSQSFNAWAIHLKSTSKAWLNASGKISTNNTW
jgi:hypothetical protein